jgi:hypothetical protein
MMASSEFSTIDASSRSMGSLVTFYL